MNTNQLVAVLIVGITLLSGCVTNRYAQQRQYYIQAVRSGQITGDQYDQAMWNLNALEQREKRLAWANAFQAVGQSLQQQQMQRQMQQRQLQEQRYRQQLVDELSNINYSIKNLKPGVTYMPAQRIR